MNLSKAIVIAAIACSIQVSQVRGQGFAQANYLQDPSSQQQIALTQCQQCGPAEEAFYPDEYGACAACPPAGGGGGGMKDCLNKWSIGGWCQMGYHTSDLNALFNRHSDRVNMHQLWFHIEKDATGSDGFDYGGRVDYVYGVDAQDTQAFGINNDHWDNDWDHGIYGSALPQAYGEVAYGKTSIKFGHFFTIIGYEVVTAPDNFFYSHAYTMVNSEPFTHSGALVTHKCSEFVTAWGGYSAGWDSGFEDNGDTVLAGLSLVLTDFLTLTYTGTYGRFNENNFTGNPPERGDMHSVVASSQLGKFNYVMQVDRLNTSDQFGNFFRDTFGINNYLLFDLCDEVAAGLRFEWYNVQCDRNNPVDNCDIYALTFGLNVKAQEFITVRPEVRWDWDVDAIPVGILETHPITGAPRSNQLTFGIDAIVGF